MKRQDDRREKRREIRRNGAVITIKTKATAVSKDIKRINAAAASLSFKVSFTALPPV